MKKTPPVSMILAIIWLAGAVIFSSILHASKLFYNATGTPIWSAAFVILGILNIVALAGFWCMRRWSIWLYYVSTITSLIVGVLYYIIHAGGFNNPEQLLGGFAAKNISGLLIFTIALLPYRKEFKGKSNQEVDAMS
ncbi:MAG: hypothetical protein WD708_10855 [Kiritimatiellia bacterium]